MRPMRIAIRGLAHGPLGQHAMDNCAGRDFSSLDGVTIASRQKWAAGQYLDDALILMRRN